MKWFKRPSEDKIMVKCCKCHAQIIVDEMAHIRFAPSIGCKYSQPESFKDKYRRVIGRNPPDYEEKRKIENESILKDLIDTHARLHTFGYPYNKNEQEYAKKLYEKILEKMI